MNTERQPAGSPTRRILTVVLFNLLVYIDIGLPMAVIPLYVHLSLGFAEIIATLAVSLQYFATFVSRPSAGRLVDTTGPKPVVLTGLAICTLSGLLLTASGLTGAYSAVSLALLLISRLALGWAESYTATGVIVWNIRRVGAQNTAQAISWNGVCSYGGIALGAPVGVLLSALPGRFGGLACVGLLSTTLPAMGWLLARNYVPVPPLPTKAEPLPFSRVFRTVLPHGSALALGSIGFGAISSTLALYFAAHDWSGAASALGAFGAVFVVVRLVLSSQIRKRGGGPVAVVSLLVEALGLLLLCLAHSPVGAAFGAAVTGAGFSLLFPALGVIAVNRAGPENRGAALGAFSVFLDLAIGLSGPLLGAIIHGMGYGAMFAATALCSLAGATLSLALSRTPSRTDA